MISSIASEDQVLLTTLSQLEAKRRMLHPSRIAQGISFRNEEIALLSRKAYTVSELQHIEDYITTDNPGLPIQDFFTQGMGSLSLMKAIPEKTGDTQMSDHMWIRDQTRAAHSLMEIVIRDPKGTSKKREEARQLLLSTLDIISTPAQLNRFTIIIQSTDKKYKDSQDNWPQIYLALDNLLGLRHEVWRHKQDAWQMLAYTTFEALDNGLISVDTLKKNHKEFLAKITPFLAAVDFTHQDNSGSWEELPVKRTSVLSIETALLNKVREYYQKDNFSFLNYTHTNESFNQTLDRMIQDGVHAIAERFPFESPEYPPTSSEYREADAALLYLLDYSIPELLVKEKTIPPLVKTIVRADDDDSAIVKKIEKMILDQVMRLTDAQTNGLHRYGSGKDFRDTYQGTNFHTNTTRKEILTMKQQIKDPSQRFIQRDRIVDSGPAAAWTHFLPQIASWAARRYLETSDESYYELATIYFNRTLSTLTGFDEHVAALDVNGKYKIKKVKPNQMTECWVTYKLPHSVDGQISMFVVPSPDTPLNWGTMNLKEAIKMLMYATLKKTS